MILSVLVIPLALWLGQNKIEKLLLLASWLLIPLVELLNSAVEATVDRVSKEHHELAGQAKDLGSAAVFWASGMAVITWVLILFF